MQEKRPVLLRYLTDGPEWQPGWRMHPALGGIADLVQRGEATLLPFTGYPNPNTSHFKSSEIWETGRLPGESSEKTGWIGRWADENLPHSSTELPTVLNLDGYNRIFSQGHKCEAGEWGEESVLEYFEDEIQSWKTKHYNHPLAERVVQQEKILRLQDSIQAPTGFPDTDFGQQLSNIAGILLKDMPFRVLHATQGGYDTHLEQPGRLQKLYAELNHGLSALMNSLSVSGLTQQTTILVYSEFGRSIDENENMGTDHNGSGLSILLGYPLLNSCSIKTFDEKRPDESLSLLTNLHDFRHIQSQVALWLNQ